MLKKLSKPELLRKSELLLTKDKGGKKKRLFVVLGGLILYLAATAISYAAFYSSRKSAEVALISPVTELAEGVRVDLSAPKIEACPLNGGMFTKEEKEIWEKLRPLTVMIENHVESRPQSGLSKADVIYEMVAEGGVTRLLVVYYCGAAAQEVTIGPIRSARTYFIDFASEYGDYPLYAHVGGANKPGPADALGKIAQLGWLSKGNDLNQFSLGFPTFWRDYERIGRPVATEHTMFSTTDKLWEVASQRDLEAEDEDGQVWDSSFKSWKFKDEADLGARGDKAEIKFDFWSSYGDYQVTWEYDREKNDYRRLNGGVPHIDRNNEEQIRAKNVASVWMKEQGPIDELKHLLYTTIGKGEAVIFLDGQAIEATWGKAKRESRTKFFNAQGKEIAFNRGPIWVEIVPAGRGVNY